MATGRRNGGGGDYRRALAPLLPDRPEPDAAAMEAAVITAAHARILAPAGALPCRRNGGGGDYRRAPRPAFFHNARPPAAMEAAVITAAH